MSWRERDYHRAEHWHQSDMPGGGPLTVVLLAAQLVAFILLLSSPGGTASRAIRPLQLHPSLAALLLHPLATRGFGSLCCWSVLTWWLVGWCEGRFGAWRALAWFTLGSTLAAAAYLAVAATYPAGAALGLSGPVGGLLLLLTLRARELRGQLERVAGHLVAVELLAGSILAGLLTFVLFTARSAAPAWLAAAIVAAAGGWLIRRVPRRAPAAARIPSAARAPARNSRPTARRPAPSPPDPARIDRILDKIRQEGVAALSPEEREQLEAARRAMLERDAASNEINSRL